MNERQKESGFFQEPENSRYIYNRLSPCQIWNLEKVSRRLLLEITLISEPHPEKKIWVHFKGKQRKREKGGKVEHHEALAVAVKEPVWLKPSTSARRERPAVASTLWPACRWEPASGCKASARLRKMHVSKGKRKGKGEETFWKHSSPNKDTVVTLQTGTVLSSPGAGPWFQGERVRGWEWAKISLKQKTKRSTSVSVRLLM